MKRTKTSMMMALALGAAVSFPSFAAPPHQVYLVAKEGSVTMPDGAVIPIWGFALDGDGNLATDEGAMPTLPGPAITAPSGASDMNVHIRNELSVPVSFMVAGQRLAVGSTPTFFGAGDANYPNRMRSLTDETAPGGTHTYSFTNMAPGTYLYRSGTHQQIQGPMGLYGSYTRTTILGDAYPNVSFGQDEVLLYSELDPALNNAVSTGNYGPAGTMTSTVGYKPEYFLINGQPFDSAQVPVKLGDIGVSSGDVMLRLLNAGSLDHTVTLTGMHMKVVAEDGKLKGFPPSVGSLLLPPGKTHDVVLAPDCATGFAYNETVVTGAGTVNSSRQALYDHRFALTDADGNTGGLIYRMSVLDVDGDGLAGMCDNCIEVANADQTDIDNDGIGNACDADLNNDGIVNGLDIGIFRQHFISSLTGSSGISTSAFGDSSLSDFNGDGVVNGLDIGYLKRYYLQAPGPSGVSQ